MYIGKLNDRAKIEYQILKKDLVKAPKIEKNGNPFQGETLHVAWREVMASGIDLHIQLAEDFLMNRLVCTLGEECAPASVSVYTENKEKLLYRYSGETGMPIAQKELALEVEREERALVVEIAADFSDIILENLEIYGACFEGENLYPTPEKYEALDEKGFVLKEGAAAWACGEEAKKGLHVLKEKMQEFMDIPLEEKEKGQIQFSLNANIPENGYRLEVSEKKIIISASDARGFVQGAETLLKLIQNGQAPACRIDDAPFKSFRGVHLYLPAEEEMPFAKRLIKYILSPMGYNHIILEMAGAMEFESHPEINRAFEEGVKKGKSGEWPPFPHGGVGGGKRVSKASVRALVAYARSFGIEVIPEIQSLGHVQFMTQAHPEIAERYADTSENTDTDERLADARPKKFYAHCFCPSNPKSYEILFDIADEIIDTVKPVKYVHMGHDEVYEIGVCEICREKNPADLLAQDICKLHEYLTKKNLKMMIWGDMLQPVTKYLTPAAIDKIPKDIVMLDFIWYFHLDKNIEDNLLKKGFEVIYGNMYSSHFPRYESRIRKENVTGAEVSAWVSTEEESLAREGKLYDFLFSAQMMWSASYSRHNRYAYDRIVAGMIPKLREKLGVKQYPSLQKGARVQEILEKDVFCPDDASKGEEISIKGAYKSLVIDHAASLCTRRLPWVELDIIGWYKVVYRDGAEEKLPITYGGNISWWNRRHNEPFPNQYYRHNGYSATWYTDDVQTITCRGERATLYRYEWINPRPEAMIDKLVYIPAENQETGVIIQKICGIK
ncbi:MAG: hypothetical protein E7329_09070 [Clostridiales bacterium]|nr:hypothetical protein [Clostridiales bacterium]